MFQWGQPEASGYFYLFLMKLEANQHWLWGTDLWLVFVPRQVWRLKYSTVTLEVASGAVNYTTELSAKYPTPSAAQA